MIFYNLIFVLLVLLHDSHQAGYALTKFAELPKFYLELRPQNPQRPSKLTAEQKYDICWHIIRPSEANLIQPDEHMTELQSNYKSIFKDLFRKSWLSLGRKYKYVNKSKSRSFSIDGAEYTEMTFICLVQSIQKNEIIPYYISDYDYNMNEVPKGQRIPGRFLFVNKQIYALAEIFPKIRKKIDSTSLEAYYTTKHKGRVPAETLDKDPVCKLDSGRKLRLCTYVSAIVSVEGQVGVTVEGCERRQFSLHDGTSYNEWMLSCKIEDRFYKYVSRNYESNKVFVFKTDEDGKLVLDQSLSSVGVITDRLEYYE